MRTREDLESLQRMNLPFPTVRNVLAELGRVAARFPFVVLCAVTGTWSSIMAIEAEGAVLTNVIMASALGLPLMFGLGILRERLDPGAILRRFIEPLGILLLVGWCLLVPSDYRWVPAAIAIRFAVLNIGLHFAVAFVPCATGAGEWEFWQFNRRIFLRFALATLYSAVLYLGFTLALASSNELFSLNVDPKRYAELWVVMAGLFNPLFFLGGAPRKWEADERDETYPRGLRGFAQFALAPLVLVFVVILYLYAGKILKSWSWPHGWVALPVCCLAVVGILAALLIQPARQIDGERWAKWYWKYFFRALGPLSVLLLLSLQQRISEYGVTEWRFYGLVIGAWLLAVSAYFTIRPEGSTRAIPASLALLCFLSVAGPWSALSISSYSQRSHLLSLLAPYGAVENGRIVPAKSRLPEKQLDAFKSIASHIIATYGTGKFPELFAGFEASPKGTGHLSSEYANSWAVIESLASYVNGTTAPQIRNTPDRRAVSASLDMKGGLPVSGYRALYHACVCPGSPPQQLGGLLVQFPAVGSPKITFKGKPVDTTEVEALLSRLGSATTTAKRMLPASEMSARLSSGEREWLMVVDDYGALPEKAGKPTLTELNIYILEK